METPSIVALIATFGTIFGIIFTAVLNRKRSNFDLSQTEFSTFAQLTEAAQKAVTDLANLSVRYKKMKFN